MLIKNLPFYSEKIDITNMVKSINVSYPDDVKKYKIKSNKFKVFGEKSYIICLSNKHKLSFNTLHDREVYPEDVISGYIFSSKNINDLPTELRNNDLKIFKSLFEINNYINNGKLTNLIGKKYVYKVNYYSGQIEMIEEYTSILKYYNNIFSRNSYNLLSSSYNKINPIKTNVVKFFCCKQNKDKYIISIKNMKKNHKLKFMISEYFNLSKCKSFFYADNLDKLQECIFLFKLSNPSMSDKIYILSLKDNFINVRRFSYDEAS